MEGLDDYEQEAVEKMRSLLKEAGVDARKQDVYDMWKAHSYDYFASWLVSDNMDSSRIYWMWTGWCARIMHEELNRTKES